MLDDEGKVRRGACQSLRRRAIPGIRSVVAVIGDDQQILKHRVGRNRACGDREDRRERAVGVILEDEATGMSDAVLLRCRTGAGVPVIEDAQYLRAASHRRTVERRLAGYLARPAVKIEEDVFGVD